MKQIKTGKLFRALEVERKYIDEEARTVELAFSSEAPVQRWFGTEILDHAPDSVNLGRLQSGGPVLMDHDPTDQVGVVESVRLDSDRVGRAIVRFGKGGRATEVFNDVVDGIRRNVSVGYQIHKMRQEDGSEKDPVFRAVSWEPLEITLTSVPADNSVGVGRSEEDGTNKTTIEELDIMSDDKTEKRSQDTTPAAAPVASAAIDINAEREKVRKAEILRIKDISSLAERFECKELGERYIKEDRSLDAFREAVLEHQGRAQPMNLERVEDSDIGLSDNEAKNFSFIRAINAMANPSDRRAQEAAAFEFECSQAAAERTGRDPQGVLIPSDVLKRDLNVTTAADGGDTVATNLLAGSFIDLLRNSTEVVQRATTLMDLSGNVAIPRQTGGATAYWVAESGAPTESQQAFDQVTLTPNTVGAFTDISRKLMIQSSLDVEALVRRDLAATLGLELDRAAINGSGASNEPLGILNTAGIGSVSMGTPDGGAPTWGKMVDLESAVSADNALVGNLYYISNAKVRGKLKQTAKDAGSGLFVQDGTSVNGYQMLTTNQVPSNLVEGVSGATLSAIIFGNLADLIVGLWSGLDLLVDPYTGGTAGTVRVVVLQDADISVRHPESFAAAVDTITV